MFPEAVLARFKTHAYLVLPTDGKPTWMMTGHDPQETVFFEYHIWASDKQKAPIIKMRFRVYGSPVYWAILDYCCEWVEKIPLLSTSRALCAGSSSFWIPRTSRGTSREGGSFIPDGYIALPAVDQVLADLQLTPLYRPHVLLCQKVFQD